MATSPSKEVKAPQRDGTPRARLGHGHVVDEEGHLVAVRRAEVLAAALVELGLCEFTQIRQRNDSRPREMDTSRMEVKAPP